MLVRQAFYLQSHLLSHPVPGTMEGTPETHVGTLIRPAVQDHRAAKAQTVCSEAQDAGRGRATELGTTRPGD